MANKINMFQADKEFSNRVAEYMRCKVWGITLKTRFRKEVDGLEVKIANIENLRGSILDKDDNLDKMIAAYRQEIADKKAAYEKQVEAEAKFEYLDVDNAFYKTYKSATDKGGVRTALQEFCKAWKLIINDTNLEDELLECIGGARKLGAAGVVRSEAKKFTDDKRSKGDVLTILYGRIAEHMISAGTLKPQQIPEDIRAAYAPKKRA